MNLLLVTFALGLLTPAQSLSCHQCDPGSDPSCPGTATPCPSDGYRCASVRTNKTTLSTGASLLYSRSCMQPGRCSAMSYNDGTSRHVADVECCSTDGCNSQPVTNPTGIDNYNGRHCYYCDDKTCNVTLKCRGPEDHCFTNIAYDGAVFAGALGCASKHVCDSRPGNRMTLDLTGQITCCQGELCNGAPGTSTSLLLLAAPLLMAVLL